ncbi:uncharacterized protein TNCV_4584201 [Trichonephila clavipes]|nr:uncharacterized protein TNCV_4584201 [Trichonephila clavipes]
MLRGWFDAFRVDGGPTLYSNANRTPVVEDIRNILIYVTFSTLFIAFLLIFPGIRKEETNSYDHKLMAAVSRAPVLAPLKTPRVEEAEALKIGQGSISSRRRVVEV